MQGRVPILVGVGPEGRPERPGHYEVQARTYDLTRGASPTVVRAVSKFLGPADGRRLLDVAGGTGNYSQVFSARGFRVLVMDAEPEMLAHAVRKLGPGRAVVGDAERLPLGDGSVDCSMMVNAVHLFTDAPAALREARRVIREGPLVVTAFTKENLASLFVYEYFGLNEPITARPRTEEFAELLRESGFSRVEHQSYVFTDTVDGSLNALHTDPLRLAGPAYLRNTSFWHRIDEETRQKGLEALARDLRSGELKRRVEEGFRLAVEHGHGTAFGAWP
jgi:SAM-dependent methyltransferase